MRRSLVAVAAAVLLPGCVGDDGATVLSVHAEHLGRTVSYELRCDPPRGDAPRPRVLCAALDRNLRVLLDSRPPPPPEVRSGRVVVPRCSFGLPSFRIAGTYRGDAVDARFVPCTGSDNPGLTSWSELLGIGLRVDPALEPLWAAGRRAGRGRMESLSRVTSRDLSIFEPVRRFRVKYRSGRCEIWLARGDGGGVRVARHSRERPCYALAPWRR